MDGGEKSSGSASKECCKQKQAEAEAEGGLKQKPLARFDYILNVGDSQAWPGLLSRYGYEYHARHELAKSRNEDYDYTGSDDSEDSEDSLILKGKSGKSGNRKGKSSRILKRRPNSDWDPFPNGGL